MHAGAPDAIIADARKFWTRCSESEDGQRKRIVAAKKFHALEQWPAAIKIQREGGGSIAGQPPQPPRPCLVVDRLSQPMRRVSNTIKNADFGFDVMPVGDGADVETAEIFKGYLRRVQNQARGESPIEWAAEGAIEGGIGWFRLRTEFVHQAWDGAPTEALFDQEIVMERIANNLTVYCDPSANKPTRSDAKRMIVTEDMYREDFSDRWPDADLKGLDEFMATGDMDGWVSDDIIRIAEFWRITYTDKPYWWSKTDGKIYEGKPPKGDDVRMSRVMRVPKVKGYKINAVEVLEEWDWVGSRIPLIPVIGEELNVDGQTYLRGIIEPAMDAQRMVNYTYSGAIEIYSLAAKKAPMIPGAAVANYKQIWDTRNIVNYSYLPYDPYDENGKPLDKPTLDTTDAPIQSSVALMQVSEEAIKATTSTGDASLGNTNPNERSGKALEALQSESDLANSNYPDNVRRAYIYAASLMLEIIPKITRPGQILHILGMDDEPEQVMVGQPFKPGTNGIPEPAPKGVTPEIAKMQESLYKFYDLNNGTYHVTVTMGKASATRRQEGALALGNLLPHLPPEMQAKIIPDYIKQLSFPGAQAIAEKLEPTDGQMDPAAAAAQFQQAQQQIAELQKAVEGDTIKAQATMEKAQLDAASRETIAAAQLAQKSESDAAKNETALAIAELNALAKQMSETMALFAAERARVGVQGHEAGMAGLEQAHESEMAAQGHQQALEQGAVAAETQGEQAEADRAHQAAMQTDAQKAAAEQARVTAAKKP